MKDFLRDIIEHTLPFVDLVKITGTTSDTTINSINEERTVIINANFKNPNADFIGLFGMPNMSKLKTILNFEDYSENAVIEIRKETRNGQQVPASIHFETQTGDFVNDYRLMAQALVEEQIKPVKFAGATWVIDFEPQKDSILRMKRQASANSDQNLFGVKTENSNFKVYFGDPSTHSGNFVFASGFSNTLRHTWHWPVKQFLSIMDLVGDKHVYVSDQGAMRITVDSGLIDYEFLLPAQKP